MNQQGNKHILLTIYHLQATKEGIPAGARWTKIDRRLVNPQALEEAQERFEERLDCVIVLRVLTKDEIQKLADKTLEIRGTYIQYYSLYRLRPADVSKKPAHMVMKIVNVANDVSTAVVNVNASDTSETNMKMMTARMSMHLENHECSRLLSMGRNPPQILCAIENDGESVSMNLLMLLVRFENPSHDDFSMQRNLRFWKSILQVSS